MTYVEMLARISDEQKKVLEYVQTKDRFVVLCRLQELNDMAMELQKASTDPSVPIR